MPKILLIANTDWFLYNFRYALVHELREQGHEVVLVSPSGKFAPRLQADGFRWLPWKLQRRSVAPWQEIFSFLHILRIYRQEKPDLVHHHTIKAVLYGSLAAILVDNVKVINSISGQGYVFTGSDLKATLIRNLMGPFYRYALRTSSSAVIFENPGDRQFFFDQDFITLENSWLIEGVGADPQRFSPRPEPPKPIVVLMAARTLWEKGVGVFVEAARMLHQRVQVRMVLVGEPDPGNPGTLDKTTLKDWHRQGVIEWWGWQQDMERIYQQAHIVTLPTMYGEGLPTTLIEAAACGRPIVATDVPGCRSIVQHNHNGLLVPQNDAQSLAAALATLALDPGLRIKMGAAGRQMVLERFTHQHINQATLQVYQHLLESPEME
jgi:glycosyltransferase involved in cell wall biosynthesis